MLQGQQHARGESYAGFGRSLGWLLMAACGFPAVPLALLGSPIVMIGSALLRSGGEPQTSWWRTYVGTFYALWLYFAFGFMLYVASNASPGLVNGSWIFGWHALSVVMGSLALRKYVREFYGGFGKFLFGCGVATVLLVVCVAVPAAGVFWFSLGARPPSLR